MKILLVGAGGYGALYVRSLMACSRTDIIFEGIVDPYITASVECENIKRKNIPVYQTMEEFYAEHEADLAIISTPPFFHCTQAITALSHGSCVLCEKPVAPTLAEAEAMLEAELKYGRFIAIGYQWSFSEAIQALKKDILAGVLGAPISFKTAISWPRNFAYFRRGSGWAGKIQKDGVTILDSIASNACAHYLHNMLFLLGEQMEESAYVDTLEADCFRANDIETFDTCTLRGRARGVPIYFAASHAAESNRNPAFVYRFEKATVTFTEDVDSVIRAKFNGGREIVYGNPFAVEFKKLWDCVDAIENGQTPICTVKTATPQTALIAKLHETTEYRPFPSDEILLKPKSDGVYVKGLLEKMYRAYEEEKLLSEL